VLTCRDDPDRVAAALDAATVAPTARAVGDRVTRGQR
jgi:hypothetical protein